MIYVLDAPGITGKGSDSQERMQAHIDAGGSLVHSMEQDDNGLMRFTYPKGVWPELSPPLRRRAAFFIAK
ncbi:MAG TPA: hypothetical protein DIW64_00780 [Cellvibrio sp.]|nr:hypothetical protein [Cellvibrio sp.]